MNEALQKKALAKLADTPRLNIGVHPTPIEELRRFQQTLGENAPRIFIKRDDYTGAGFGGNKVRKLDYVLAQAIRDGVDTVLTIGGEKSNHCRATAAMCARVGLDCVLILNRSSQTADEWKPASLVVDELVGAKVHLVDNRESRQTTMHSLAEDLRSTGKRVLEIPLGASMPLGALGYVQAAQEAAAQLEAMNVRVTHMFHSSSSGGTQAGLIVGAALCPLSEAKIIGVSPDDPSEAIAAEVSQVINGLKALLEISEASLHQEAVVLDDYIGEGYGIASAASSAALKNLARTEGIILDPVYTAKAFAGMLDWIKQGRLTRHDTVLFWHTGGQLALFYSH
ncbi:MAG: D-cysteine desulfhydrase family protein [Acidobacteriota bacterium]